MGTFEFEFPEPSKETQVAIKQLVKEEMGQLNKPLPQPSMNRVMVLPDERLTILLIDSKKYVIKCHNDDKFDYKIGIGIAISKHLERVLKGSFTKELKLLKTSLDYKDYAEYCLKKYYAFDLNKVNKLFERVRKEQLEYLRKVDKYKDTLLKNKILTNGGYGGKLEKANSPKHRFVYL